jgi:hypothetical protein
MAEHKTQNIPQYLIDEAKKYSIEINPNANYETVINTVFQAQEAKKLIPTLCRFMVAEIEKDKQRSSSTSTSMRDFFGWCLSKVYKDGPNLNSRNDIFSLFFFFEEAGKKKPDLKNDFGKLAVSFSKEIFKWNIKEFEKAFDCFSCLLDSADEIYDEWIETLLGKQGFKAIEQDKKDVIKKIFDKLFELYFKENHSISKSRKCEYLLERFSLVRASVDSDTNLLFSEEKLRNIFTVVDEELIRTLLGDSFWFLVRRLEAYNKGRSYYRSDSPPDKSELDGFRQDMDIFVNYLASLAHYENEPRDLIINKYIPSFNEQDQPKSPFRVLCLLDKVGVLLKNKQELVARYLLESFLEPFFAIYKQELLANLNNVRAGEFTLANFFERIRSFIAVTYEGKHLVEIIHISGCKKFDLENFVRSIAEPLIPELIQVWTQELCKMYQLSKSASAASAAVPVDLRALEINWNILKKHFWAVLTEIKTHVNKGLFKVLLDLAESCRTDEHLFQFLLEAENADKLKTVCPEFSLPRGKLTKENLAARIVKALIKMGYPGAEAAIAYVKALDRGDVHRSHVSPGFYKNTPKSYTLEFIEEINKAKTVEVRASWLAGFVYRISEDYAPKANLLTVVDKKTAAMQIEKYESCLTAGLFLLTWGSNQYFQKAQDFFLSLITLSQQTPGCTEELGKIVLRLWSELPKTNTKGFDAEQRFMSIRQQFSKVIAEESITKASQGQANTYK